MSKKKSKTYNVLENSQSHSLIITSLVLIALGLIQVYSSSFIFSIETYDDGLYFFKRQCLFAFLGITTLFIIANVNEKVIKFFGLLIFFLSSIGVILTLIPGIGVKVGGAHRWLSLPMGFRFEPSEMLKYSFGFLLSYIIMLYFKNRLSIKRLAILGGVLLLPLLSLLLQPDFGTFIILSSLIFCVLFVYGLSWKYIISLFSMVIVAVYFLVINVPYRLARIEAFLDPWANQSESGFQVIQSLLSFYSGGFWGKGLGFGQGKLFFLPEAHTDFTLAVLGEELGFIGVCFLFLLYIFIFYKGLQISLRAESPFYHSLALSITMVFSISVLINIGVALGLLPPKGLTLPFISYGGSSLVSTCFGVGVLINIERLSRQNSKVFKGLKIK
jgi:cell division protein FtsW